MSRRIRQMVKAGISMVFLLVLGINILTVSLSTVNLRQTLGWMPYALLCVESGSMEPSISAGDGLLIYETPYEELAPGDLITFHRGEELITHQIISVDGNQFITKGSANNYFDAPVGLEEYCAKVVLMLPGIGWILNYLKNPMMLALFAIVLFVAFWGHDILSWFYDHITVKNEAGESQNSFFAFFRRHSFRTLTCACMISVIAAGPFMTAAKYTARINRFSTIAASSINFSSNYLSPEGNTYYLQGWNASDYTISLAVRNYSNDLLMNKESQDLYYGLGVIPVSGEGYGELGTDYEVEIIPDNLVPEAPENVIYAFPEDWPASGRMGPYFLSGSTDVKLIHGFQVRVHAAGAMEPGEKVRFILAACTSKNDQFFIELSGDFTFEVAESTEFLSDLQIGQTAGASLVTYGIKTKLINDGTATKNVRVSWNTEKLYINEFESSAYNIILNQPGNYHKELGEIIMPLQAYSSLTLQFFKINAEDEIDTSDITAVVMTDDTEEEPTEPTEPTEPDGPATPSDSEEPATPSDSEEPATSSNGL